MFDESSDCSAFSYEPEGCLKRILIIYLLETCLVISIKLSYGL